MVIPFCLVTNFEKPIVGTVSVNVSSEEKKFKSNTATL